MAYKVSPRDSGEIKLSENDTVSSVLQNIAIILSTRQQSVPLYRGFGLPHRFVDKPVSAARPIMVAEIQEAIMEYEPRATLLSVTFAADENAPEKLVPIVEVEINEQ